MQFTHVSIASAHIEHANVGLIAKRQAASYEKLCELLFRQNVHRSTLQQAIAAGLSEENLQEKFCDNVPNLQPEIR